MHQGPEGGDVVRGYFAPGEDDAVRAQGGHAMNGAAVRPDRPAEGLAVHGALEAPEDDATLG